MAFNHASSFVAGGTIAPCSFAMLLTTGTAAASDHTVIQATAGAQIIGITQEGMQRAPGLPGSDTTIAATVGTTLRVYGLGDECLLQCGGTVTRGDRLKSDGSGFGVTASTGNFYGAVALENGVSGQKIRVVIVIGTL